jgi:hypothetical protein
MKSIYHEERNGDITPQRLALNLNSKYPNKIIINSESPLLVIEKKKIRLNTKTDFIRIKDGVLHLRLSLPCVS